MGPAFEMMKTLSAPKSFTNCRIDNIALVTSESRVICQSVFDVGFPFVCFEMTPPISMAMRMMLGVFLVSFWRMQDLRVGAAGTAEEEAPPLDALLFLLLISISCKSPGMSGGRVDPALMPVPDSSTFLHRPDKSFLHNPPSSPIVISQSRASSSRVLCL